MKYALVSIDSISLPEYIDNEWVLVPYPANTISNLIVYDGVTPYTPPSGFYLASVLDDAKIGDPYLE